MRPTAFLLIVAASQGPLACGGSQPPSQAPTPAGSAVAAVPAISGDAGPTTTTTQSLGGAPSGVKLTAQTSGDGGADAGPKHRGEPGRTVVDIQTIVASRRDEARACYDNALANHPGIEGNIDIRWTIDPTGKVTEADLDTSRSEIVEPAVANCLLAMIRGIHFNASPKGFETKAHYPFNFHPRAHHTVGN